MEKRSFSDYLKIIKEEKEEIKQEESELKDKKKSKKDIIKEEIKEKNKEFLDKIKQEKTKKEKKSFNCPVETTDVALNLKNRQNAIENFEYGPLNPLEENKDFWEKKVEKWRLETIEEAKNSLCGNCAAFVVTKDMLNCISKGLSNGDQNTEDAWATIEAGQLGFCEAFDFKCSAMRTCDAWIVGGPITDNKKEGK